MASPQIGKAEHLRQAKISPEFDRRLDRLEPKDMVRAVLILRADGVFSANGQRQSRANRKATIEATREAAQSALINIDDILERFGGHRLADNPDALGTIPVESTASGIRALAESKYVKAILQDQAITLLSTPKR